jgi:phosphate transport system permease protein
VSYAVPQSGAASGRSRGGAWSDTRVERTLGALSVLVLVLIGGMVIYVFNEAWPSFAANGLGWFSNPVGGLTTDQQIETIFNSPAAAFNYDVGVFPLIWGTLLSTGFALVIALVVAVPAAVFIVEFAPGPLRAVLERVVRLLASVPSVLYGLIGILLIVPLLSEYFITEERRRSVLGVIQLEGSSLLVATLILATMIVPIIVAIVVDALRSIPNSWKEGAAALGVNRSRVMWTISVRAARPAIIAAAVLATARALGEAIMLAMVSGSIAFSPQPIDGPVTFFLSPISPLAATIVRYLEGQTVPPLRSTLYAMAAVLLVSAMALSLAGWAAKQPLKKYGVRA